MAHVAVLLTLILAGCTKTAYVDRPVEVLVPIPVERSVPDWLATPYLPEQMPAFIAPTDPTARAALAEPGLHHLKTILRTFKARDEAWRAWAIHPGTTPDVQPE